MGVSPSRIRLVFNRIGEISPTVLKVSFEFVIDFARRHGIAIPTTALEDNEVYRSMSQYQLSLAELLADDLLTRQSRYMHSLDGEKVKNLQVLAQKAAPNLEAVFTELALAPVLCEQKIA